jgi:hypothetical protein
LGLSYDRKMSYGEEELELNDSADHDFLIFKVDLIDTIVL